MPRLEYLCGIALNASAAADGWAEGAGVYLGCGGQNLFPSKHLRNPRYLDGSCVSAGTSFASHSVIRKIIF